MTAPCWVVRVGAADESHAYVANVTPLAVMRYAFNSGAIHFDCLRCARRLARRLHRRRRDCGGDASARVVRLVKRKRGGK
jgi:hypothetical protein